MFLSVLNEHLHLKEKILLPIGAAVSAVATAQGLNAHLSTINLVVGIVVGLLTVGMLIPRAVVAWREMLGRGSGGDDPDNG